MDVSHCRVLKHFNQGTLCLLWTELKEVFVVPASQHLLQCEVNRLGDVILVVGHIHIHLTGLSQPLKVSVLNVAISHQLSQPGQASSPQFSQSSLVIRVSMTMNSLSLDSEISSHVGPSSYFQA